MIEFARIILFIFGMLSWSIKLSYERPESELELEPGAGAEALLRLRLQPRVLALCGSGSSFTALKKILYDLDVEHHFTTIAKAEIMKYRYTVL
jgi:hypothetical protein